MPKLKFKTVDQQFDEALALLRQQRDGALRGCDWTQLADAPISALKLTQWRGYRQALRDLTNQLRRADGSFDRSRDPAKVSWPERPS